MKPIKRNSKLFNEVVEYMTQASHCTQGEYLTADLTLVKSVIKHPWTKIFLQENGLAYIQSENYGFDVKFEVDEDERCSDCGHTPATGACFYCKQD